MTFQEFKKKFQHKEVREVSFSPCNDPVVSVLVQTFQQKEYITECLESILLQQTSFPFEILVGEDGSKDGTREICLEYASKYPDKIRLFLHHRENQIKVMGGPTSNFNALYNYYSARGIYIAFCEGDDKWSDPLKLEKQVKFLENNPTFSFSYHSFRTIDEHGDEFPIPLEREQPKADLSQEELLQGKSHPLLVTMCFKKNSIVIPEELFEVLNVDTFLLSLFGEVGKAKFQDTIFPSLYRLQRGGLWSKKLRPGKLLSKIQTFHSLAKYFKKNNKENSRKFFVHKRNLHYKMLIIWYLKNKKFSLVGRTVFKYFRD